jgi:hypothetical protein
MLKTQFRPEGYAVPAKVRTFIYFLLDRFSPTRPWERALEVSTVG